MKYVKKELNLQEAINQIGIMFDYERSSYYISTRLCDAVQWLEEYAVNAVPYKWLEKHRPEIIEEWENDDEY